MTSCDPWLCTTWVSRSSKVTWGHWPRLTSQWQIANRHMLSGVSWGAESEFVVHCSQKRLQTTSSSSPRPIIVIRSIRILTVTAVTASGVMPFYLGTLRMLNIATGFSNYTLSCSELNGEHAGEGFRSLRHILLPLWACKSQKCRFSRKFDLWPDLTRPNVDLGLKTIYAIARSRRDASTGFFREALRPSGADRQGGGRTNPPPLHWRRWRNTENGRGLRWKVKVKYVKNQIFKDGVPHSSFVYRPNRFKMHQSTCRGPSYGNLNKNLIGTY